MNDLETLLRNEFDEAASSVPETAEPWEAFRRRLARRRAVLVGAAAAAAVVVVLLAVGLVPKGGVSLPPASGSPTATTTTGIHTEGPPMPADTVGGPFWITDHGGLKAYFFLRANDVLCVATTPKGQDFDPDAAECARDIRGDQPVRTRSIGPVDGPFGNFLLVIVDPGVHDLVMRDGGGSPVEVTSRVGLPGRNIGLAEFPHGPQGFGYDGIDAHGEHFSAIT